MRVFRGIDLERCLAASAAPSPTAAVPSNYSPSRDGCTEAIMLAHGFSIDMMVEIINAGLASASTERAVAGRRTMQVTRVRITEAGRRALAALKWP
jgi:hypothetical protein